MSLNLAGVGTTSARPKLGRGQLAKRSIRDIIAATALLAVAVLAAACGGEKPVIRVHSLETDSQFLSNAIFEFIVENGYGYPVEQVIQTTQVLQQTLPRGEVDLNLEGWQQNFMDWYEEHTERGDIVNLGMIYEGGPQFFMIPKRVAEEYDIKTVFDMADHWELFRDPDNPSKGVFYNCIIGWRCGEINRVKLEAYGLTRFYNLVSPSSEDALEAALSRPQEDGRPVFGYGWAPTSLVGAYDWHILEEPPYNDACWEIVTEAAGEGAQRPIERACAYPDVPVDKIAHAGLLSKAPDVVKMLEKMVVGLDSLNQTLAWAEENNAGDWRIAAIRYLDTQEARWISWVTPEALEKIRRALADASG